MNQVAAAYPIVWFLAGTLGIGMLCGAVPLVVSARTKQQSLGLYGFFACILSSFIAGVLLAVPVALAFTVALIHKSRVRPKQSGTGSTTVPLTTSSTPTLGVLLLRATCLILCIIALAGTFPAALAAIFSVMFFDAPGSMNPITIGLVVAIWSYPLTATMGGLQGIKSWRARDLRATLKWTALAYSSVVFFGIMFALSITVCDGQFDCP